MNDADMPSAKDYFLRLDGIPGGSSDDVHHNEIELLGFSWGVAHPVSPSPGGVGTGKVSFSDLTFTAAISAASPLLFLTAAAGGHVRTAALSIRRRPGPDYLTIELTDVLVTSYREAGSGERPDESVSLSFATVRFSYRPQNADGTPGTPVVAGWDVSRNRPL